MRAILVACWLVASSAFAQVNVPVDIAPPQPFIVTLTLPTTEGATHTVEWANDAGTGFLKVSDTELHVGAFPGEHWLQATVKTEIHGSKVVLVPGPTWPLVPTDIKKESITFLIDRTTAVHRTEFTVEGELPVPVPPKPLAILAGDKAQAIGTMYDDLKTALTPALIDSVALFRTVHKDRLATLGLAGNGAAAEIDRRLNVVLVEPWDAVKVGNVLAEFVAELGSLPPPVDPPVDPTASPVSFDGFHVLFVEETVSRPAWFLELTASPTLRTYLNTHCKDGANGWRRWDQNAETDNAPAHFKEMLTLPRTIVPSIVIAANKQAVVKPLSQMTDAQLIEILKPFGGP